MAELAAPRRTRIGRPPDLVARGRLRGHAAGGRRSSACRSSGCCPVRSRPPRRSSPIPPTWLPSNPRWSNYADAWHAAPFGRFYINSLIIMIAGTAIKMVNAVCTAYALVFLRFPVKNLIFLVILAGLMVPEQVTILPNYVTFSDVFGQSWINTYQGIILPGAAIAFGTFLLRQTFLGLPREVIEAARLDGCSHLRLLWDIVHADGPLRRRHRHAAGRGQQVERVPLAAGHHHHRGDATAHRRAHLPRQSARATPNGGRSWRRRSSSSFPC